MPRYTDKFRAMDTGIDLFVESADGVPPFGAFNAVHQFFATQEERFSRFRPTSLLSRLNAQGTLEDAWLAAACRLALHANQFTGGLFNPLILPSLEAAGYSKTFTEVSGGEPTPSPAPPLAEALTVSGNTVTLTDARIDLGGIIKGWTVDLAIDMVAKTEPNAVINAGGDLRVIGAEPYRTAWFVVVTNLFGQEGNVWEGEMTGAVATSTSLKRRWTTAAGKPAHHLIDPRTGLPSTSPFVQVSAWHPHTWQAECWAKAVLIDGHAAGEMAAAAGVPILAIEENGARTTFGTLPG